jgi:hypothetical protein
MFESAAIVDAVVTDRDGNVVDVRALLPRGAQILEPRLVGQVAEFACRTRPERSPYTVVTSGHSISLLAPRCGRDVP